MVYLRLDTCDLIILTYIVCEEDDTRRDICLKVMDN